MCRQQRAFGRKAHIVTAATAATQCELLRPQAVAVLQALADVEEAVVAAAAGSLTAITHRSGRYTVRAAEAQAVAAGICGCRGSSCGGGSRLSDGHHSS